MTGVDRGRWIILGGNGMLGRDVSLELATRGIDHRCVGRREVDVTDPRQLRVALRGADVVVNCAAWTAVDDAEAHAAEAFSVNAMGAAHVARACRDTGAALVQISTDYVFGGDGSAPYDVDDPTEPRSIYGQTKLAGEWAVRATLPERSWVLRTAWLYGAHGPNFVATMVRLEAERANLDVVSDQSGQPTWTADLARRIADVVEVDAPSGVYHATNSGQTTWNGLARRVFELVGADPERIREVGTEAFPRPAPRPRWSVLGHGAWAAAGLPPMRDWRAALDAAAAAGVIPDRR